MTPPEELHLTLRNQRDSKMYQGEFLSHFFYGFFFWFWIVFTKKKYKVLSTEPLRLLNFSANSNSLGSSAESSAGLPGSVVANKSSLFNTMANQPMQIHKPNHGKPNLAPKPPGAPPGSAQNSGKTSVARHHSMKSPRYWKNFLISLLCVCLYCHLFQVERCFCL